MHTEVSKLESNFAPKALPLGFLYYSPLHSRQNLFFQFDPVQSAPPRLTFTLSAFAISVSKSTSIHFLHRNSTFPHHPPVLPFPTQPFSHRTIRPRLRLQSSTWYACLILPLSSPFPGGCPTRYHMPPITPPMQFIPLFRNQQINPGNSSTPEYQS